jgi:CHAD domain-containing protein
MAYRLKRSESIPEGIKRVSSEQIDSAIDQLSGRNSKKRPQAVHEARKSIKKVRGALRLVEPELGSIFRDENSTLRDIGRELSVIRDAEAIIEVFDGLVEKFKDQIQHDTLIGIRRGLQRSKRETEKAAGVERVTKHAVATLRSVGRRVETWPLKTDGFRAIAPGLENAYRRGRKALRTAQQDPTAVNYHDLRKRAKDHWYHVRLLENLWSEVMQAQEASLKNLQTWLGDDHNLVVLREKLESEPGKYGDDKTVEVFLTLADQHQRELRDNSISLAERVYDEKPKQLTLRMSKLWDAWQNEPDSMKEIEKEQRNASKRQPATAGPAKPSISVA